MQSPAPESNVVAHPAATERADAPPARVPPHNFEVEIGLLAALMANNRAFEKVGEFLEAEHESLDTGTGFPHEAAATEAVSVNGHGYGR